jgi:hypothetical protein
MKLKHVFTLVFLGLIFGLTSCQSGDEEVKSEKILPDATGRHSEIVLVADSAMLVSPVGKLVDSIFQQNYPLLFKKEPFFKFIRVSQKGFGRLVKTHQNVIILKESDTSEVKSYTNIWSKEQRVLQVKVNNQNDVLKQIDPISDQLFKFFYYGDIERLADRDMEDKLDGVYEKFQKKNLRVVIPSNFHLAEEKEDFIWFRRERPHITESITIFEEDYTSTDQFDAMSLLEIKDSVSATYVQGSRENSVMVTEYRVEEAGPIIDTIDINGVFGVRTRGWWKLTNDFMGGYFIRYSFADEKRGKLYHVEAFIYCPKYDKMFYLRELEAILFNIKVIN